MQIANKLMMFNMVVRDMPTAKAFYAETLGLSVTTDYRQNDDNWWVTLTFPEGGTSITLAKVAQHEPVKAGTIALYFATSDVATAHKTLRDKGANVNDIGDDLFGPGSGVKWFNLEDPEGNMVYLVQA